MKHRTLVLISALALLTLLGASPVLAKGTVSGHVTDREGNPVEDVRIVIATAPAGGEEASDAGGRTFKAKTNRKGSYLASVENGNYILYLEGEELGISELTIHIEDREHEVVRDWTGRVIPGDPSPDFRMTSGDTITLDVVVVDSETLNQEYANFLLANVAQALEEGDRDAAMEMADNLLTKRPNDAVGLTLRAYMHTEEGRFDEAEADLTKALEENPDLVDASYQLGALYRQTGREEQALALFREIAAGAELGEHRARALLNIGEMERAAGNNEAAIAAFEGAVEAMPEIRANVAPELVALFTATGQTEKAEEWLATAPDAGEMDPTLQYNIAVAHFNNKEWPEAVEAFRSVIAAKPEFADAYRNLGYALLNLGEQQEALDAFRKYLELAPEGSESAEVQQLVDALAGMLEG